MVEPNDFDDDGGGNLVIMNMTDDREDVMCGTSGRVTHEDDQDNVVVDGGCGGNVEFYINKKKLIRNTHCCAVKMKGRLPV